MSVAARSKPLLEVVDLHAYYGKSHILQGVTLNVCAGEIVALLGRNGAGRSTTIKAIMGVVPPRGSILFKDRQIAGSKPHEVARSGIGCVPENRDIFPTLTVRQNLILGQKSSAPSRRWTLEHTFEMFPQLRERADTPAGVLSGGEQQMLTMCRTMMGDPELIMVDEPTEGLAPMTAALLGQMLVDVAARGVAILLVEQKLTIALKISRRVYVMGQGRIVFEGEPASLVSNARVRREWLEV
jgi:branched-chain amino acid transport system ATP-binding protein